MSSNSSNSSNGGVILNPPPKKQIAPSIRWTLTLNNYTKEDLKYISSIVPVYCKKWIIGFEVGDSGTAHLQGYIELKKKARPKSIFKTDRIHWEKAKGSAMDNLNYCSKEQDIFMINGMPRPLKPLACENNLRPWQADLSAIVETEPHDREIFWYWSSSGNTGKTTFARYLHRKYDGILLSGKSADMKNAIMEYQKTNGYTPELIIIDLPRGFDKDYLSYNGIEEIKNMFFYSGKYEGGMVDGNPPHLIVFCNELPKVEKMSKDRWVIVDIETYSKKRPKHPMLLPP